VLPVPVRGQRWLLVAVSGGCFGLPFVMLGGEAVLGRAGLAPWPLFFFMWPPLLVAWLWAVLGLPGMVWVELAAYFLVEAVGLRLAASASPVDVLGALAGLATLPVLGVLYSRWAVAAAGALLAVACEIYCIARLAEALPPEVAVGLASGYALLFAALGVVHAVVAGLLRRREDDLIEARRHVEEQDRLFRLLADNAADVIALHDVDGRILYVSPSCRAQLGYEPEELIGGTLLDTCHVSDAPALRSGLDFARAGRPSRVTCRLRTRAGGHTWYDVQIRPIPDPTGGPAQVQSSARDISERKAVEEQLTRQALHDALTGLPNRACFQDQVRRALAHPRPVRPAVLFIDLDDFKRVNDSLGHEAGDELLRRCGERMAGVVDGGDTLARLGGDEFAVLMEGVASEAAASALAERIGRALRAPLCIEGADLYVTASIGLALTTSQRSTAEDLLRDADVAMYQAKSHGKAQYSVFEPSLNAGALARLQTEVELREALAHGELRLHYQPIIDLDTGAVRGFEALVRWQHPTRGLVLPGEFIPAAEANGLIVPMGRWVLAEACRQAREWQGRHAADPPLLMSVNVSARQIQAAGFAADVEAVLAETGVDPRALQLEITETALLSDDPAVTGMLAAFRAHGIRLAIDDFGLGYASMGYLGRLAVDELKIDRSFVHRLGRDAEGTAIVRSLLRLARDLSLSVSGEGIETEEQWELLRHQRCRHGQGFFFSRPMPPDAAGDYLARSLAQSA